MSSFAGHLVDILRGTVTDAEIIVKDGIISAIVPCKVPDDAPYYLPGFIDAHVHIESSMMLPTEFARIAKRHGTVGAICDPHEIANVLGISGVELMLDDAKQTDFYFGFGAPSCVPSCGRDIEAGSGQILDSTAVASLLEREDILMLSEMMNYPGVLNADAEVMAKLEVARKIGKPVDGHAPGLRGRDRFSYAAAGITTDHECTQLEEAKDAIASGMKVIIREGSAAKNYEALSPLIGECPDMLMFCTDDAHSTDLVKGHINQIVKRAIKDGYPVMDVLRIACLNPIRHYGLKTGILQVGDNADFIAVTDLSADFEIIATFLNGARQEDKYNGHFKLEDWQSRCTSAPIGKEDIVYAYEQDAEIPQIVVTDGSIITDLYSGSKDSHSQKLVTYNRYVPGARPQVAYIRGFGITNGAIAQTISHDCHNIIAIGSDDDMIVDMVNRVITIKGGIAATDGEETVELPLPVGGILSDLPGDELAKVNMALEQVVHKSGCKLTAPFITLSFMALPVIPHLKLTDRGLFDGDAFRFYPYQASALAPRIAASESLSEL